MRRLTYAMVRRVNSLEQELAMVNEDWRSAAEG